MSTSRKTPRMAAALVLLAGLLWLAASRPTIEPTASAPPVAAKQVTAPPPAAPVKPQVEIKNEATPAEPSVAAVEPVFVRTPLPAVGARGRHRPWVRAGYGPANDQLGFDHLGGGGEIFPPQGHVVTSDGKLLVLDSNKMRLVRYDAAGKIERIMPLANLAAPADVAIAADGTIAVVDYAGVQTKGIVMLDPEGKQKAVLPQIQTGLMTAFYAAGNNFYIESSLTSVKAGDSSGSADDEITGLYENDGDNVVPGHIAPDGITQVRVSADDPYDMAEASKFFVEVTRGDSPVPVFTRHYQAPSDLAGVAFGESNAKGQIYVVLFGKGRNVLVCIDGNNGDPVGSIALPHNDTRTPGTQFRVYALAPSGGLVYQRQLDGGVSYDWYDCH